MNGMTDKGGFDYIKTHDDAEKMANAMRDDLDKGVCEIGFEIFWTIAQRPEH
jgi:hypothetical protein